MDYSEEQLKTRVFARDYRAIARLITRIEYGNEDARRLAASMRRQSGRAHLVGVTGAPGAGKSTLVNNMAMEYRSQGASVAILAVDPTSPFSGGAILGDRIRMNRAADDPTVFIRSMATRGSLGGLAKATLESLHVLDCAGFDLILLETVGVGQAEVDVVRCADTCVVVLVPGMGDSVQLIKAGLMEIADIFVINKADRDGALSLEKELYTLLSLAEPPVDHHHVELSGGSSVEMLPADVLLSASNWRPKVIKTVATEGSGVGQLVTVVKEHLTWLESSSLGGARRHRVAVQTITAMASDWLAGKLLKGRAAEIDQLAGECVNRSRSPLEAVELLVAAALRSIKGDGD
jgi:LAO/AO transport system kinase